ATPQFTTSSPQVSKTSTSFVLKGTADSGPNVAATTVQLYTDGACAAPVAGASATGAAFAATGITVILTSANTAQTYYAAATDTAGNTSACSSTLGSGASVT